MVTQFAQIIVGKYLNTRHERFHGRGGRKVNHKTVITRRPYIQPRLCIALMISLAHAFIFRTRLFDKTILVFAQQIGDNTYGTAGIEYIDRRAALIARLNLDRRMGLGGRRSADQERDVEPFALHLPRHIDHFIERRRDQT